MSWTKWRRRFWSWTTIMDELDEYVASMESDLSEVEELLYLPMGTRPTTITTTMKRTRKSP